MVLQGHGLFPAGVGRQQFGLLPIPRWIQGGPLRAHECCFQIAREMRQARVRRAGEEVRRHQARGVLVHAGIAFRRGENFVAQLEDAFHMLADFGDERRPVAAGGSGHFGEPRCCERGLETQRVRQEMLQCGGLERLAGQ